MRRVFADTSAFIALHNPRDAHHASAGRTLEALLKRRAVLVTTNFILDEALTWFRRDAVSRELVGRAIRESAHVEYVRLEEADEERAWEMCLSLRDKDFSFTDLTSFALMERLKLREAFTFDRDFRRYGRFQIVAG